MPVRLLHSSDWHLGHVLKDVDREAEQQAFLDWVAKTCEAEAVHGLLVAGDVFDVSNPPTAALAMWSRFLVGLWRRMPRLHVVVIGGNHDSAHRLEVTDPFLEALERLHVLGALPRRDGAPDLDRALVRIEGDGGEAALVAAIPFLRAADLRAEELGDATAPVRRVHAQVFAGAAARRQAGDALVAMGHLFVAGGSAGSAERTLVGGIGAVPADVFPAELAYVALGHLHRPQAFDGGRIRYSGAPLPLSFDEAAHAQQAVIVTLTGGALAEARAVDVPQPRRLLRLPEGGAARLPEVLAALDALPPAEGAGPREGWPLLEVRVLLDQPEPGLQALLDARLEGRAARLVRWERIPTGEESALADEAPGKALGDLDPVDVLKARWTSKKLPGEPPEAVLAAFAEVLDLARAKERTR